MLKRLSGSDAAIFKNWFCKEDTLVEVDGECYLVQYITKGEPTITEEVESDPELKQELLKAMQELDEGQVFTTQDILDAIERGV